MSLDDVEGLDTEDKDSLRRVGITSADDLERIENRNVDVEKVVKHKTGSDETGAKPGVDYGNLARLIKKAKRNRQFTPQVMGVALERRTAPHSRRPRPQPGARRIPPAAPLDPVSAAHSDSDPSATSRWPCSTTSR